MARELIVRLTDDVDGSTAVETITFAFRGVEYEIDLSSEHVDAIEHSVGPWIERARKVGPDTPTGITRLRRGATRVEDLGAMRTWGRANGYRVSERGRVPAEVRAAYRAAHG